MIMVIIMKKMNIKGKKKKRYLIYLFIIYLTFSFTFYFLFKNNKEKTNEEFINFLLSGGNIHLLKKDKLGDIVNNTVLYLTKVNLKKPDTILNYTVFKESTKKEEAFSDEDEEVLKDLEKYSFYMEDPNKVDQDNPLVYIYNTHQLENYNDENLSIYNITPNVLMASYILKEKLNKLGISTIVEDANIKEFLTINNWSYNSSYKATRLLLLDKKTKYSKSLKYFIDFHRDSVPRSSTTIKINDKSYAKVMFVIGLENENNEENIKQATKLNNLIIKKYPSLSKGLYKKKGPKVNGVYNQDVDKNCFLIEVGGIDNTIEEVFNTLDILSEVLADFIRSES